METYELVGVGQYKIGDVDAWMVTYEKGPAEEEGGIPDFHHHLFPAVIFSNYAEQFGMDLDDDDDFDEILEIVLYEAFAGDDDPADEVDPPPARGLKAAGRAKNKTGRRMRRRADRGKGKVSIEGLGIDGIRAKMRTERHKGRDVQRARMERLEPGNGARGLSS